MQGQDDAYDAAGNLTTDGNHTYFYDAENRLMQVDGSSGYCSTGSGTAASACYLYDALGRRAEKTVAGKPTDYIYDLSGNVLNEYNNVCAPVCQAVDYFYLNGQLIGQYENSTTYFIHTDHLGSTHLVSDVTGAYITDCFDYLPFGEANVPTAPCSSGSSAPSHSNTSHEFTGDERDSETSLDHTWFRQYSSQFARWTSPDPAGLAAVDPSNPQSWNRYAYVGNNPMNFIDPLGLSTSCGDVITCVLVTPPSGGGKGGGFGGLVSGLDDSTPVSHKCLRVTPGNPGNGTASQSDCGGNTSSKRDVNKTWTKTFGCSKNAPQLMLAVQDNMARFADNRGTLFAANFPNRPLTPGGQYMIQPGLNPHSSGYILPTAVLVVTVTSQSANGWTFTTDPLQHYFNGTVSFSATDTGNGNVTFSVTANANYSSSLSAAFGWIIKAGENSTWNNMLTNVQNFCKSDLGVK